MPANMKKAGIKYKKGGENYYKSGGSLKAVPTGNKGLGMLPTEVRNKMGYMEKGGEKLLTKMTYGGSMDMVQPMIKKYGGACKTPTSLKRRK
jgi:hypothetical protein